LGPVFLSKASLENMLSGILSQHSAVVEYFLGDMFGATQYHTFFPPFVLPVKSGI